MPPEARRQLAVVAARCEAKDVLLLHLEDPSGAPLASWSPGAHIELHLSNGLVRHYSLCGDPADRARYVVAVGLAADSRGGSQFIHERVRAGTMLTTSEPQNNFPLEDGVGSTLFIAGGIGITPIVSMVRASVAARRAWTLLYSARSRQRAAFYEDLRAIDTPRVTFHFDDERAGAVPDVYGLISTMPPDGHVYCCGPPPMMAAVRDAATALGLDAERLHVEYFTPPAASPSNDRAFTVGVRSLGRTFDVPPHRSILDVLEAAGVLVPYSCREGLCATCKTRVLGGVPDHRDSVLSPAQRERGDVMTVCVSRALSEHIELAL